MSKYLKTYEEWNPFLSKEEKARRAEEEKRKQEEEKARLAEEEKRKKQEELDKKKAEKAKKLKELGDALEKYPSNSRYHGHLNKIKLSYENDRGDFLSYDVDFDKGLFKSLYLNDVSDIELDIYLSSYLSSYLSVSITIGVKISVPKEELDIPDNILEILKSKYSSDSKGIGINSYSKTVNFEFRINDDISNKNDLDYFLNRNLTTYGGLQRYLDAINSIYSTIDNIKDQERKKEGFKSNTNNIMDCFAEISDMCTSHSADYIEKENYYRFVFNITGIRPKSQPVSKYSPITKAGLYLNDKTLEFFYLLSEAKPRVNDIVPNCEFDVDIETDKITLIVK